MSPFKAQGAEHWGNIFFSQFSVIHSRSPRHPEIDCITMFLKKFTIYLSFFCALRGEFSFNYRTPRDLTKAMSLQRSCIAMVVAKAGWRPLPPMP